MLESREPEVLTVSDKPKYLGLKCWQWWFLVAMNITFLLVGQSAATLLGRFYYEQGGSSKWMATLVQTVAFPVLYIPLFLIPSSPTKPSSSLTSTLASITKVVLIYFGLGVLIAADNMLYSVGLLYLPVSTYSLLCATQLAFNAIFSYLINSQRLTVLILNSVALLTMSAALLAVREDSTKPTNASRGKYILGFISTLSASAVYSLLLSLMQFSFEKVLKKQTFAVVLQMQIYTSFIASCACVVGLFASGEWHDLTEEMNGFGKGRVSYVMTLVWTAVSWQICSVGVIGLIFVASSLFSNAVSTFALPLLPIAAVVFFHEKLDGVKVVAMLVAVWGCASYIYQHYLDDSKSKPTTDDAIELHEASTS